MIADEIKDLMQAQPFRRIRIVLSDKQSFVVAHTDYLMISPGRKTVVLYDETGHFRVINVPQIRLVEPVRGPMPLVFCICDFKLFAGRRSVSLQLWKG